MAQVVDYTQAAEDHRSLLVLVRHAGAELSPQCFNRIFDRISGVSFVHVSGQKREISVRYRRSYSVEANAWGEFQAHRKVLGVITVGECLDHDQYAEVFANYKSHKEEYSSTVINSRLLVFGLNSDGSPLVSEEHRVFPKNLEAIDGGVSNRSKDSNREPGHSQQSDTSGDGHQQIDGSIDQPSLSDLKPCAPSSPPLSSSPSPTSPSSQTPELSTTCQVPGDEPSGGSRSSIAQQLDNNNKSKPSANGVTLTGRPGSAVSPNRVPSPNLSRPHSDKGHRRTQSLPKESSSSEVVFYPSLDSCPDVEEKIRDFVTSLFFVLEGKRLDRSFERNEKSNMPLCAPFEKKDFVGVDTDAKSFKKKCMGRLRKHLGDLCLQAAMPGDAVLHYNTALDSLRSVNDFLWIAGCLEGLCCANVILSLPKVSATTTLKRNLSFQTVRGSPVTDSRLRTGSSYANGLDAVADTFNQPILNIDDVVEKYKEAISNYAKFKAVASIELEACLKACRFLIHHHKRLQASDFLQNALFITFPPEEDDKIQRHITLSTLYSQLGFTRKAAFFRRVAGMHCVVPNTTPSWSKCYELLLQCLSSYGLSVDPKDVNRAGPSGWPVLQNRVLNELVFSARKMANPQLAVRHMTLLVDLMLPHIGANEQREVLTGLSNLTSRFQGTPQPIALESGLILPPVPLLSLPTVRSFRLLPPSPHLEPTKLLGRGGGSDGGVSSGVFLYKPSFMTSRNTDVSKPDFKWTCGDVCEASLQLFNPLAEELKLTYMGLMTSDLEAEILPANPTIAADSGLITIKLKVKPKAAGILKVLGYTTVTLGVESSCKLRELRDLRPSPLSQIEVEVIPPLPTLTLSCSLPKSTTFSTVGATGVNNDVVASGSAVLFAGQSTECIVTVKNTSDQTLDMLSVKLNSKSDQDAVHQMISWSEENIHAQLPLDSGSQLCFSLLISGNSDFLVPAPETPARTPMSQMSRSRTDSEDGSKDKVHECVLSLQYSGGEGLAMGYCRQCSLALNVDILPSVYVSNWTVQHTDSPSHCRLALDLTNQCGHQLDVQYGQDKSTSLGPLQTRRICMEVPRLEPSQVDTASHDARQNRVPRHYRSRPTPDPHSQALASYVDIRWSIPSAKAQGKVGIDYLTWTQEQLLVLMATKVLWEVHLNERCFLPSSRFSFRTGDLVNVSVTLENNSEENPAPCALSVEPRQVTLSGDQGLTPASFAAIGSWVQHLEQIAPGTTVKHSCSFVFFTPGFYSLSIVCSQLQQQQHQQQQPESSKAVVGTTDSPQKQSASPTKGSQSDAESKQLRWVCGMPVRFEIL